jgi:predicted secreted Zn-dependent protease
MKNLNKQLFLIITFIFCAGLTVSYAQESSKEVIFIFHKKGDKFSQPYEEKTAQASQTDKRYTEFSISGLETQQQVDKLIQDIKKYKEVVDFSISSEIIDNQRKASIIFDEDANMDFFKRILLSINIKNVIIDGEKMHTQDIE